MLHPHPSSPLKIVLLIVCGVLLPFAQAASQPAPSPLATAFMQLTANTAWEQSAIIDVGFDTFHPQGFARVGDHLFLSSVEIIERTRRFAEPRDGLDRSVGVGKGHLFKMDLAGRLLAHIELGEGAIYHPGGIDFDGEYLWVPVAEYRPDSKSIIYRVHPETLAVTEVVRIDDHIGGVVHNTDDGTLHGITWGSRRYYTWRKDALAAPPARKNNPAHYIDYQDCQYVGSGQAICAGLNTYRRPGHPSLALGGLELIDLLTQQPVHQIPVALWTEKGQVMTQNPVELEVTPEGLRVYFMPEDNESRLFVYTTPINP